MRSSTWIIGGEVPLLRGGGTGSFEVAASFQMDALSATMLAFVSFVGFLIHLYSVGYMHDESDRAYSRYFSYLNLFVFFMLLLVLGGNLPLMFVGWEGVGLCSYLLIGFWYKKQSASDAGKKAFLVNRVGSLVVVDKFDKILGIVAPLDILKAVNRDPELIMTMKVEEVMSDKVIVASPAVTL